MRGHHDACTEEHLNRRRGKPIEPALDDIAAIPVLLALAAFVLRPGNSRQLAVQTGYDGHDGGEKPAPVAVGTAGMHGTTVRTTPSLEPERIGEPVKVAGDIAVPPKPRAPATGTPPWSWPRVELAQAKEFRQNDRQG